MKKEIKSLLILIIIFLNANFGAAEDTFKIGWISPLTGSMAKNCAHESGILAIEEINETGGILGRPLELIMEDGSCDAITTISAAKKLINIDKVDYILGGHCSTSSLALAPIAQKNNTLVVSSISSHPQITKSKDFIFRTSSISTDQSPLIAKYLIEKMLFSKIAIFYEDTAYAGPIAKQVSKEVKTLGAKIIFEDSFLSKETDFRASLMKIKSVSPQAIYLSAQTPDTALLLIKQLKDLGINLPIFGNHLIGNLLTLFPNQKSLFNDIIYAEIKFDTDNQITKAFIKRYTERFNRKTLPYGIWNADAYDAVHILANAINRCGPDKNKVKQCLANLQDFPGASGNISFDENGDAKRKFVLKKISHGEIKNLQ